MLAFSALVVATSLALAPMALAASASDVLTNGVCNSYFKPAGTVISGCGTSQPGIEKNGGLATQIVNTLLYVAGIVSLVFIIIGGIRYLTSTGDSGRIQSAKDTILYAVIGLIVTFLAVPIADFIIAKVSGG